MIDVILLAATMQPGILIHLCLIVQIKSEDFQKHSAGANVDVQKPTFTPKSCDQVARLSEAKSGAYEMNFLKSNNSKPAVVECLFEEGLTGFGSFQSEQVEHCSGIGCFTLEVKHSNLKQMKAMMKQSSYCFQEIIFDCKKARINVSLFKT